MNDTKTQAIIFDCFGVIVSDALTLMVSKFAETHHNRNATEEIRYLVGLSNRGLVDTEKAHREVAAIMGIDYDKYRHQIDHGEIKDHELLDYIKGLRQHYKIGLLSNISKRGLEQRFREGELEKYFDAAVASGDIGYAKPEPEAYQIVVDRLGVPIESCIFVDDIERYCDAAETLGMRSIWYRDFEQFRHDLAPLLREAA
jgi:HAD superfamily hydrolase (TIGR01509 family)